MTILPGRFVTGGGNSSVDGAFKRCPRCQRGYQTATSHCELDGAELLPAHGPTLLGRVLARRYRVQTLLGVGGMGEVYKVQHLMLDRPMAIKVLLPMLADRSTAIALLHREARNASRVEHLNAVQVHDLEFDDGLLFLTMDYAPGPTLVDVVRTLGPLNVHLVADIISQVARGLEAVHAAAIVHRDLKPSNVVLTRGRDGRCLAKVLDFGISRAFDDPDQSITRSGLIVGTPAFMSPEQRSGVALDKRADVFALGALATYLLAGRLPNVGPATCLRLSDVNESRAWPDVLRHVLLHAMMWERTQRAVSAERVAHALRDVATTLPREGPASIDELLDGGIWQVDGASRGPHPTPAAGRPAITLPRTAEFGREEVVKSAGVIVRRSPGLTGARVQAVGGPLAGSEFAVGTEAVCIGRDARECPIAFPESASLVSRIHASILWNAHSARFVLQDEGSKNATFVNGRRLDAGEPVELDPGATFAVGHEEYCFRTVID